MQIGASISTPLAVAIPPWKGYLLNAYFDKNYHWRMGLIGDLRNAYGVRGLFSPNATGCGNIVGPGAVVTGGHYDVGESRPWLWGVDFGVAGRPPICFGIRQQGGLHPQLW